MTKSSNTGLTASVLKKLAEKGIVPVVEYDSPPRLKTGSLAFDNILGGGLPIGRVTQITGHESTGKSTLMMLIAGTVIENGGKVAFFDTENTYTLRWADSLGINPEGIELFHPDHGESMLDGIMVLIEADIFDLIIVDSVASTPFIAELKGDSGDAQMGLAARRWSAFKRVVQRRLAQSNTALVLINQINFSMVMMGNPETTYGGKAIKYLSSIIIRLKPLKNDKETRTIIINPHTKKNKTADPDQMCNVVLLLNDSGEYIIDTASDIAEVGKKLLVFTTETGEEISGNAVWWFRDQKLAGGMPRVIQMLMDDPELHENALQAIYEKIESVRMTPIIKVKENDDDTGD